MNNKLKYILAAACVLVLVVISLIVYRMFFQFDGKEIRIYADEEAQKYGPNKADVYCLILEGVEYILSSHNLTQQVLRNARALKTDPEQELVHAAIAQCKAFQYLAA